MGFSSSDTVIKNIGRKIKEIRNLKKMTQFDLAILSDMEENAIQRIETGRTNPTVKTLLKVSNALEIPLVELFTSQQNL